MNTEFSLARFAKLFIYEHRSSNFLRYATLLIILYSIVVKMCLKEATNKLSLEEDNIVIITGGFPNNSVTRKTNFMKIEEIH